MAGFADIVRNGVRIANRLTGTLQVDIRHQRRTTLSDGTPVAAGSVVTRSGLVEYKTRRFQGRDGIERTSRAKLTFLSDVTIDEPDLVTLPDGTTGPILSVEKPPLDPAGGGYLTIVWLGASSKGGIV